MDHIQEDLARIHEVTGHHVQYVGEWHSHPDGVSLRMSNDDRELLGDLTEKLQADGIPGIVLIVGENGAKCQIGTRPEAES